MSYTPHKINSEKNFISGWYIDKDFCSQIIKEVEKKKILLNRSEFDYTGYYYLNLYALGENIAERYLTDLLKIKDLYYEEYPYLKQTFKKELCKSVNSDGKVYPALQLQKYKPNNYYSELHCENSGRPIYIRRCFAFMTYLNTIDHGGGTAFPYQNTVMKAEQGLTLIWPAYYTHPHKGVITDVSKYIITGWFETPEESFN